MLKKFLHWWKYGSPDPKPKVGNITTVQGSYAHPIGTPIGPVDQEERELFDVLVEFEVSKDGSSKEHF